MIIIIIIIIIIRGGVLKLHVRWQMKIISTSITSCTNFDWSI